MTRARKLIASFDAHTLATVSGIYSHTLCAHQVCDAKQERKENERAEKHREHHLACRIRIRELAPADLR
jgi:hypothetical protein